MYHVPFRSLWQILPGSFTFIPFSFLQSLTDKLEQSFNRAKELNSNTRRKYQEYGQAMPADAGQKVGRRHRKSL